MSLLYVYWIMMLFNAMVYILVRYVSPRGTVLEVPDV